MPDKLNLWLALWNKDKEKGYLGEAMETLNTAREKIVLGGLK